MNTNHREQERPLSSAITPVLQPCLLYVFTLIDKFSTIHAISVWLSDVNAMYFLQF